ncbi:MAG: transglutaminase family protein [Phenylobacterium sp.]|nr:MAG: transglutaminase family protein [Phenylobacterium sp.]
MRLFVQASLAYRFPHAAEVLLLVEAARSPDQAVHDEHLEISPAADLARLDDSLTGERRAVFTAQGDVEVTYWATVEVLARDPDLYHAASTRVRDLPPDALKYLRASKYCPSDRFEGFVQREFGAYEGGAKVAAILGWLSNFIEYRAGASDASTTALDTFVDRAGVCRDFAHLAITFCRAAQIPARAVSAYAWNLTPPDMHLVAEVYLGGRWRLIDPTGKAPTEGIVRVATGLDAMDVAFMTIFGEAELLGQTFAVTEIEVGPVALAQPAAETAG